MFKSQVDLLILLLISTNIIVATSKNNSTRNVASERFSNSSSHASRRHSSNANNDSSSNSTTAQQSKILTTIRPQTSKNGTSSQSRMWQNPDADDYRVPFWNIAHMINSIDHIEQALRAGSNGLEVDISFDKRGVPVETYHGFPCDCGRFCHHRESFVKFVRHIGLITLPNAYSFNRLQLVVLDLKLKDLNAAQKQVAGRYLASILDEHVYQTYLQSIQKQHSNELNPPPVRVIVSINHVEDNVLVRSFIGYLIENRLDFMSKQIGFDVGMNDKLSDISAMWDQMSGYTFNIWQGDGLTNCANIFRGVERLKEAIRIRNGQGHFRKVYFWTADVMYLIRSVLRLGIDALLTNQPQRVLQVLEEPEFKAKYRLATPFDDPFSQFWIQPSAWHMFPPSLSEAVETVVNIRKTSANFVKTLPDGIAQALKKVQHSILPKRSGAQ